MRQHSFATILSLDTLLPYRVLLTAMAIMFLTSCVDYGAIGNSWVGQHIDDLIYSWGPPESVYELKDGRKVIKYSHSREISATTYYCNATFSTDTTGVIRNWTKDGNLGGCNRLFGDKPKASTRF